MTATTTTPRVVDLAIYDEVDAPTHRPHRPHPTVRLLGSLVIAAGIVLGLSGAGTWAMVQTSLSAEKITVAEDAARFAGQDVNGPLTAYYQADIIEQHALEASKGLTYAELDREDPVRETAMTGSLLRASLFTSVVSFGVAAMAFGLGIALFVLGYGLLSLARSAVRHS